MHLPSLIALDWGGTNLRATLLSSCGIQIARRVSEFDARSEHDQSLYGELQQLCADWLLIPNVRVIANSMISGSQGLIETPYIRCPASAASAAAALSIVRSDGQANIHLVPGVRCDLDSGMVELLRGEETQIWGSALDQAGVFVLPGFHSKWVRVNSEGAITDIRTFMTGELYELLSKRGFMEKIQLFGNPASYAYRDGVRLGLSNFFRATNIIFSARSRGLAGTLPPEALPDYLSGILIGSEVGAARYAMLERESFTEFTLIGNNDLSERYLVAMGMAGLDAHQSATETGTSGLLRVARLAGLIEEPV